MYSHINRSICFVILDDNGGGIRTVTSMIASAVNSNSVLAVKLVVLRKSSGWLSSLNLNVELVLLDSPRPSEDSFYFLQWLNIEKPNHIFLNGCWSIYEFLPLISRLTLVSLVVHDFLWSNIKPALVYCDSLYSIVAVSQIVDSSIRAHTSSPLILSKLRLINNGISIDYCRIIKDRLPTLTLSFFGGAEQRKGAFFLRRLLPVLCSRFNHSITLYWAGSEIPLTVLHVLESLPLLEVVRLGNITHLEVESILAKSSILLVPSYREAFGMVILEAIKCGCIPIAWDLPGGPQQILSSDPLFKDISLVPPFNLQAYCSKIIQAYVGARDIDYCFQQLLDLYSIDITSQGYVNLVVDSSPYFFDPPSQTLSLPYLYANPSCKHINFLSFIRYVFNQLMIVSETISPALYHRLHLLFYVRL